MIVAPRQKKGLNHRELSFVPTHRTSGFSTNIQHLYDHVASVYSRDEPKFRDDLISRPLIVELAKYYGFGKRIVDVGCGDGHISRLIGPFAERVVGIDISGAMLGEAYQKSGLFKNVTFLKANFLNLKPILQNQKFDVALGIYAFCCMKDLTQLDWAFRSIYQVLEHGGTAIIQVPDESEQLSESRSEWVEDSPHKISEIGKLVMRRLKAIDNSCVNVARYHYRQKDYLESVEKAGFRVQEVLKPRAPADVVDLYPSLKHEAEVFSSLIFILRK